MVAWDLSDVRDLVWDLPSTFKLVNIKSNVLLNFLVDRGLFVRVIAGFLVMRVVVNRLSCYSHLFGRLTRLFAHPVNWRMLDRGLISCQSWLGGILLRELGQVATAVIVFVTLRSFC